MLKKNRIFVFIFPVILLILAIVIANVFQKEIRSFFYWFSSPIQKFLWQTGNKTSDLNKLEQEIQGLTVENIRLKSLEEENKILREALSIGLERQYNLFFADIISKDISEDIVLINKGLKDGVKENMSVITGQKVLVGKIIEVFDKYSKVMLFSHKNMSFDVKIEQEEKEINAMAQGQGNSNMTVILIPREEQINKGDVVVTSGLGGVFPEYLLMGRIKDVIKNDLDPFQTATIENYLEISGTNSVFIIND